MFFPAVVSFNTGKELRKHVKKVHNSLHSLLKEDYRLNQNIRTLVTLLYHELRQGIISTSLLWVISMPEDWLSFFPHIMNEGKIRFLSTLEA